MLSGQEVRNRLVISTQTMERWLLAGQFPTPAEHPGRHKRSGRKWTDEQLNRYEYKRDALAALKAKPADAGTARFITALYSAASAQSGLDLGAVSPGTSIAVTPLHELDAVAVVMDEPGVALVAGLIVAADPWTPIIKGKREPLPARHAVYLVDAWNTADAKQLLKQITKYGGGRNER